MSEDLVKRIARTLADMQGQLSDFEACASNPSQDYQTAFFSEYMMQADELLRRSGLAMELHQLRCRQTVV